jgi:hypothetical protein
LVAEITDVLSLRFGSGVAAWCSAVPALADEVAGRWGLTLGDRYAYGASSVVLYCSRVGGGRAVLKLSPDPPFLADQAAMLGLFAPSGRVPEVLAVDRAAGAVLLELIEPGTAADELPHRLDGGPARGLVAIDPRACTGDPCFDAVDYALDGAGQDGVENRCADLAPAAGLDPDRLFARCRTIAPIIAISRIGRPGSEQDAAELLTLAR